MSPSVTRSSAKTVSWPDEFVENYVARGYWEGRPLGSHLYGANAPADETCLVDGDVRLSRRELMARADGAALRLLSLGVHADDRIVIQLPNCWEFIVLTVACLRLGAIPVMALPAHRRVELSTVSALTEPRAIVVADTVKDFDHQALALALAEESPSLEHVLVVGTDVRPDAVDARALCEPANDVVTARKGLDDDPPAGDSVAVLLLSGGTTGIPKLVARTHNDFAYMARRAAEVCRTGPDAVYLAVLPLSHGFPMSGPGVLGTLMAGGRVVIASSPLPEGAFALIERERVTDTSLVPAILMRWLEHRELDDRHDISSLRLLQVGAARFSPEMARRVAPSLGCTLQQVYGMSEGLLCLTRPDDPDEVVCHTQGRPICPDDELSIVDDDGDEVGVDEPGVLLTRGPYTPRGYYAAPEENARAFVRGWYRTGDIVRQRPDGNLVVEGRDKDIINRGGEKISTEEIENVVRQVAGVQALAAVAMPDPELGERVCLYVVSPSDMALDDLRTRMECAGIARFKLPERLVLVDELPTTTIGKTDKKALRNDIRRRLSAESGLGEEAAF